MKLQNSVTFVLLQAQLSPGFHLVGESFRTEPNNSHIDMKGRLENLGAGISFLAIFYGALRHSAQTGECSEFAGLPSQGCDRQPYELRGKARLKP